jgi:predicted secreted hydrolase
MRIPSIRKLAALLVVFAPVVEPRDWSFPEDHGSHREFQTEWWYYTGHLTGEAGERFGYELVFFRHRLDPGGGLSATFPDWEPAEIYPAHLALTDESGRRFRFHQKVERAFGGMAGADSNDLRVWCGAWRAERKGSAHHLTAAADDISLTLQLVPLKPPVLHGEAGISRKGPQSGQASYYYSLTRLATSGVVTIGGKSLGVTGASWMDHEFFSSRLDTTLVGWDWFSLQLDDGSEIMLYRLRGRTVREDWPSGTFVLPDGRARSLGRGDFTLESRSNWTSPTTGVTYPARWTVRVPSLELVVDVVPTLPDQELDTRSSTGVIYWEGSATISGTRSGKAVTGRGYVELTGYGGMSPMSPSAERRATPLVKR